MAYNFFTKFLNVLTSDISAGKKKQTTVKKAPFASDVPSLSYGINYSTAAAPMIFSPKVSGDEVAEVSTEKTSEHTSALKV